MIFLKIILIISFLFSLSFSSDSITIEKEVTGWEYYLDYKYLSKENFPKGELAGILRTNKACLPDYSRAVKYKRTKNIVALSGAVLLLIGTLRSYFNDEFDYIFLSTGSVVMASSIFPFHYMSERNIRSAVEKYNESLEKGSGRDLGFGCGFAWKF